MPNIEDMIKDPDFLALSEEEQVSVLETAMQRHGASVGPMVAGQSTSTITGQPLKATDLATSPVDIVPGGANMGSTEPLVRPLLEGGGAVGGSVIGTGAGPLGTAAGGGLGYAAGKGIADKMYGRQAEGLPNQLLQATQDVGTGLTMELAGPVLGKAVSSVARTVKPVTDFGKAVIKETLGSSTGAGPGMVDEALKGGKAFTSAMRGETTGSEVVDTAMGALQSIRNKRANEYIGNLSDITKDGRTLDLTPIGKSVEKLKRRFNVKTLPDGTLDTSRIAMGKKGREDIAEILELVNTWGQKEGDNTAVGLDVLKRQLDDFYSDSSQARSFVQSLKSDVVETISGSVPQYKEMTKAYSAATDIIMDIESNLMMRKSGMSGKITPDQTLRRLTSAMRENFEMRKELVKMLGKQSGEDVIGAVAGYSASQAIPRGLVGKLAGGSGAALAATINPYYLPLLSASSPRAVGEFLKLYGSGLRALQTTKPAVQKAVGYGVGKLTE